MSCTCNNKPIKHTIVLQQLDANAYPLPDTAIPVKLSIYQKSNRIEIQFPDINFQTQSIFGPANEIGFTLINGGSLGTLSNPLPKCLRPNTIKTFSCSNNDAYLAAFSITVPPPTILSAFNLIIDTYGRIRITGAGSYAGIIPTGGHTFNSQTVTYYVEPMICPIKKSFIIDHGFTDITQFQDASGNPNGGALGSGVRDSHANDNFNGIVATAWAGNSNLNPTLPIMNLYIAIGSYNNSGKLIMGPSQNLTNFNSTSQPGPNDYLYAWDTAIAINRTNPNVIVASTGLIAENGVGAVPVYFISTLGGQPGSWTGPILLDPIIFPQDGVTAFGDCRGVLADSSGNFWYCVTLENSIIGTYNCLFYFMPYQGSTWTLTYQTIDGDANNEYDYPQITAGTNGKGQQGLWFLVDYYSFITSDFVPHIGFIPENQYLCPQLNGTVGDCIMQAYPNQINVLDDATITVDDTGTLYISNYFIAPIYTNYTPQVLTIKNPPNATTTDPLDPSLLQYSTCIQNTSNNANATSGFPGSFWFNVSVNTIIYDNSRQVLYSILNEQPDINSQDFYMYMKISFNKGVNFSPSIQISNSHKNNRGFVSMALDECSGTMIISWYSGQNSPTATTEQYFGLFLSKKKLDRIVECARDAIV
jgi:hypothetical protein